ncbi:MAG: NAD-dependent epimerase/dehydratase family protein [Phycisphaerales bacterium]
MGTVLLTGSAGFIGSHLAGALLARGERVVGVDNLDPFYAEALKRRNIRDAGEHEFVEADITDAAAMRALFERVRPEGVIHLAAKAGVRPSIADPVGYARVNVLGTAVVLEEAQRAGCRRVVVASSSSVYGNNRKTPFAETDPVDEPISPYASTKRACELIGHAHWALTKMPTAMLRFFTVYGPRQRPDLAIMAFMRRIAAGEEIGVFGDGSMSRDFTYVDDVVRGVLAAYDRIDGHGYRIWNLGSDRPVRLDEMVAAIARVVGREPRIRRLPKQPGDVERTWADLTRSRADLGYSPAVPFEDGLHRQWEWLNAAGGPG